MKKCIKCGILKNLTNFPKRKDSKDGYRNNCKMCKKIFDQEYYEKNFERDKEQRSKQNKIWYRNNREKKRQSKKKWLDKNPNYESLYYQANRKRIIKRVYSYKKNRLKNDIVFKLSETLRNRFYKAIIYGAKQGSVLEYIGCSVDELREYLEKQFYGCPKTGIEMSWENYGLYGWHIDHIMPLAAFDLTDKTQLFKAWHYSNLQPLWAEENLRKGAKIPNKGEESE